MSVPLDVSKDSAPAVGESRLSGNQAPSRSFGSGIWAYCLTALLCLLVLMGVYKLHRTDLRIPLETTGDALFYEALFKNFVEAGRYNINPQLGAPGQLELYDFPVPHSTHLLGYELLRLFTGDYGLIFNLYYLATYPLAAVLALYVFRRFGVSNSVGIPLAVLYAFLPFHLRRSEAHYIHSAYYLVPLAVLVALWLSTGVPLFTSGKSRTPKPTREGWIALVICILIAGDNPYYAFFAGIFLAIGGLVGQIRFGIPKTLFSTILLGSVLAGFFALNLVPNVLYFHQKGSNPIAARAPGDAEIYGLKIIQMVAPVTLHRSATLARWKDTYNKQAPLINENDTATLGLVGAIGFFALLSMFFLPKSSSSLYSLAMLNLGAVLVGTIGGLGSLFSFAVWSQFRGYNRLSVFIGFVCLFAVGLLLDAALGKIKSGRKIVAVALASCLLGVGLADQIPVHFLPDRRAVEAQAKSRRQYFSRLETSLTPGSMVFQLPYIPFPQSSAPNQLGIYEELLPYLYTKNLHWSHGSMRGREADHWNAQVSLEPLPQMVTTVAAAGFAGILVDCFGYADKGASLKAQLMQLTGSESLASADGRYAFFSLAHVIADLRAHYDSRELDEISHPVYLSMGSGCWPLEVQGEQTWNWCDSTGELVINNTSKETRQIQVEATIRTGWSDPSEVRLEGVGVKDLVRANTVGGVWKERLNVPPGQSIVTMHSEAPPVNAPGDTRHMVFTVQNLKFAEPSHP